MSRRFSWALLVLIFSLISCADQETNKNIDAGLPFPSKPLPTSCSSELLIRLGWTADRTAFGYTIEVATENSTTAKTYSVANTERYFLVSLERGFTYSLRATKFQGEGISTLQQVFSLYVPTCAERVEWQRNHPTYFEPYDRLLTWVL